MALRSLQLVEPGFAPSQAGREPASVVLVGSYPPRRCGIATFTCDVYQALTAARPDLRCEVFAMTDEGGPYDYPSEVALEIAQNQRVDYYAAAARLSVVKPDVVFVQHEFGIYGGSAGENLLLLLDATDRPVVSLLHTVLDRPDADQRRVFERLLARSSRLIVMAEHGRQILREVWKVADSKIEVIPHGAPDRPLAASEPFKEALGFAGTELLFSFGLLSPNKGLETVIRSLPAIVEARPKVVYAVLGATHPHLVAKEGERYRTGLLDLARELGVEGHLRLIDEYTDTARLVDYLRAADIYLTPYLNPAQITSGTLSYAAALGVPTVSTPYWHAQELLGGGAGRLVPFGDSGAIAAEVIELLSQPTVRQELRERIYAKARGTVWSSFAERALAVLGAAQPLRLAGTAALARSPRVQPSLEGVRRMTDGCGMLQHSLFDIPDRRHGYCVDDNARALLLMNRLPGTPDAERSALTRIYAAFVQHAWNPDLGSFRNFMSYERTWLEPAGSEDSTGRAFWSVADTVARAADPSTRRWAEALTGQVLPHLERVTSPRAVAFILLGLSELVEVGFGGASVAALARAKLDALMRLRTERAALGLPWFEATLAYDNARLPEALIRAGVALGDPVAAETGIAALKWLCARQTSDEGLFLPVATGDIGLPLTARTLFDQQPVEAAATIDACEAALLVTQDPRWAEECDRAFAWYFGANTLGVQIARSPGDCFDGLTWNGTNENMGAESVLSLQLAACVHVRAIAVGVETTKTAAQPIS